ncbi:hypothetical protein HH_1754 [Helicobacter hepaticus ATCC 51449]|uniref:Uncharacterized protein n=1 Tax=Helicobacter hepaticus (strain ATCC 51449 / 3B1) TaxID=235279 RepID=Q7VFC3_HELHP|nr:hypothetical protein HH_1754 [Helicobacter hepaticus ATCC 51449]
MKLFSFSICANKLLQQNNRTNKYRIFSPYL